MTTEERKRMIDKIVGLLSLADSTCYDEEATTARTKAGELMAKYAIAFTDISKDTTPQFTTEDYTSINPSKAEKLLENAIGKFNGILAITVTKRSGEKYIRLVGSRENIESHQYMMDMVKSQRNLAWNIFLENMGLIDKKPTLREKQKWLMGYSYGVNNRVWDLIEVGTKQQQEWGLIVIDPVTAARDWYEAHRGTLQTSKGRSAAFSSIQFSRARIWSFRTTQPRH